VEFRVTADPIDELDVDTIVLSAFVDERPLKGSSGLIDWRICGRLSRMVMEQHFNAERYETLMFPSDGRIRPARVLMIGLGRLGDFDYDVYCQVLGFTIQAMVKMQIINAALPLPGVGLAGLEYGLATERLIEEASFKYRQLKEREAEALITIVAGKHRLREVGAVLNKHGRAQRGAP